MKSFSVFCLLAAMFTFLDCLTPVMAKPFYQEKKSSQLSDDLYTYAITVKTTVGEMDVEIHAEEQNEIYVKRVAQILKEDAPPLIEYFGYVPWNVVHFLVDGFVSDRISSRANGAATVHPRPLIMLFTAPPVGMQHLVTRGDWIKTLVLHELIHILHIDQTAGFMKVLRYLMGSDGKLGGVVPSWFAEGVATWGETKFTNGGRLSRGLFSYDFNNRVLEPGFCDETPCLDNPGKHPYLGARYWFGSHFLTWVENKKPGSLACIIKNNADNIPFFLHWAFRDCVKEDFQVLFEKFHKETKSKLLEGMKEFRKSKLAGTFKYLPVRKGKFFLFSNGVSIKRGKIYLSTLDEKRNNFLSVVDLKKKKIKEVKQSDIIESILPSTGKAPIVLKTFREFPSKNPSLWKELDLKTNKLGKSIDWSEAKYVFPLSNRVVGLLYKKNTWEIWELKNGKKEKIFDLPPLTNIYNPEVIEEGERSFLSYRYYDHSQTPSHEYLRVDLDSGKEEVLFQADHSLEVIGSCGTHRVLASKDKFYALNIRNGYLSNLPDTLKELVFIGGDDQYTVTLFKSDPRRIYYRKQSCEKWIDGNTGIEIRSGTDSQSSTNKNYIEDKSSYPEWDHFLPQRWGIGYSGGDTTSGWTFNTTINDPGFVHTLDGQYKIYTDNDEYGGTAAYLHSNDYFDFGLGYIKYFVTSNIRSTPDAVERSFARVTKDYYFDWLGISPSLGYSQGRIVDFLSNRKFKSFSFDTTFFTQNIHYADFLRSASLSLGVSKTETLGRKNYLGYRGKTRFKFHPSYSTDILLQGTYEKLDKNDLSSGAAYAGGFNDVYTNSYHEFYGIQTNDAFGNEVYSGKLEVNLLLNEAYSGPKYFPLYIKKVYGTGGTGVLKSDFIFIDSDKRFLVDKTIMNVFAGMSADVDAFYLASVRIDLLMAQLISSEINEKQTQFLVLIKAGL